MFFRAVYIAVGTVLIRFDLVIILFGLFLKVTGIRMAFGTEKQIEPGRSPIIRLVRRLLPVTSELGAGRFFAKVNGVWHIMQRILSRVP
jgi:tellurite resistance protein TerC